MPLTTVAYYEAQTLAAAYLPIAAVADQHVRVVGDDIQMPTLNQIVALAGGISSTTLLNQLRLSSPSLRERGLFQVSPVNVAASNVEPGSPHRVVDLRDTPLVLVPGEQLNAEALGTVTTEEAWCIAWLADGPIAPVKGNIFTVRVTGAAVALTAGAWNNRALTFEEDLPRGRYQLVGMRPESAGMIAARAVFVGGGWRPGALGCNVVEDLQNNIFRYGNLGVLGEFEDIEPPTIDFLSVSADTLLYCYLDLIQVRKGPA
jgi:hypothetical protein